jgi:abhydrolase domain-containing protein 1/3
MADVLIRFMSYIHASSSHLSAMVTASWKIFLPVCITCNVAILISHYFALGRRNPLMMGGTGNLRKVLEILSTKVGSYHPTIWTFGGILQTVFGDILRRRPHIEYTSKDLETPDGGIVTLDWTSLGNMEQTEDNDGQAGYDIKKNNDEQADDNTQKFENESQKTENKYEDIVLILPGLTGCSRSGYVLQFAEEAIQLGYRVVVLNHRGITRLPVTYRFSCAANSDDLELVVEHIHQRFPKCRICAVGVSLGGMITTNYLVRMSMSNKDSGLHAGLVISIPYDSFKAADSLEKPVPCFLFNRFLTRKLQKLFVTNRDALLSKGIHVPEQHNEEAAKANTIRQFDDAVIAPMFGYKNVGHYYHASSIVEKPFECIKTPLLCLSADDDPFSPTEQIPTERIKNCDNVALLLTHTGGHVGFLEGLLPVGRGYMDRVYKEFIKAAFDNL